MRNPHHATLLQLIKENSGKGTQHTSSDSYLGNSHPRYEITAPVLRKIAKEWSSANRAMTSEDFAALLTSLVQGESSTEKVMAGMLLDYSRKDQRNFEPQLFVTWLDHLEGWAEIDAVCTNKYTVTHLPLNWKKWKSILKKLSTDKNINKRRASLVFLCSPVRHHDDPAMAQAGFENILRLQSETSVMITRAISWLLRSMVKFHKKEVQSFVKENSNTLPKIAVRETMTVLKTGKKTK